MGRPRKNDIAASQRAAKEHLDRARALGASLDARQREGQKRAVEEGVAWVPDDLWRADFEKVASTIARMERAISGSQEANQKQLGGMTIEQLESQFKSEMIRAANAFTAKDWAMLDRIRMKQALE